MSISITTAPVLTLPPPTPQRETNQKSFVDALDETSSRSTRKELPLLQSLKQMANPTRHLGKTQKNVQKLAGSLEKMFSEATKVDRETGEKEIKHGGLKRVAKDLNKLFKGLGMPPQLSKVFANAITEAMKNGDTEQIDFSFTASRSLTVDSYRSQKQTIELENGAAVATSASSRFQLAAVQVRTFDFSLNLRSGEFSYSHNEFKGLAVSSSESSGVAVATPAQTNPLQTPPSSDSLPTEPINQPLTSETNIAALVQSDSTLLQLSNLIQQSAIMQLKPSDNNLDSQQLFDHHNQGLERIKTAISQMEELAGIRQDLFEPQVAIRDMRLEKADNNDDLLRFTIDATSPIGLKAKDDEGRSTTIYPREDGTLAKISDDSVSTSA